MEKIDSYKYKRFVGRDYERNLSEKGRDKFLKKYADSEKYVIEESEGLDISGFYTLPQGYSYTRYDVYLKEEYEREKRKEREMEVQYKKSIFDKTKDFFKVLKVKMYKYF